MSFETIEDDESSKIDKSLDNVTGSNVETSCSDSKSDDQPNGNQGNNEIDTMIIMYGSGVTF